MTVDLTLDNEGRISIPQAFREELHLNAGDRIQLESNENGITLTPMQTGSLVREDGIWVVRCDKECSLDLTELIAEDRDARYRHIIGFDQ